MSKIALLPTAVLSLCFLGACADRPSDSGSEFETDPALLQSALHSTVLSCQRERVECRRDADDRDARQACDETFADCLREAADDADRVAEALGECREQARQCVREGESARSCRREYQSCAADALNGDGEERDAGGPSYDAGSNDEDAATEEDGGEASSADAGVDESDDDQSRRDRGRSGGLLSFDAGAAIARLPQPLQCAAKLRACVVLDRSAAMSCAEDARTCLAP